MLGRETKILGTQHRVWVVAASFNRTFALNVGQGVAPYKLTERRELLFCRGINV